jgi:homoserine O-acetyltransferase
MADVGTAPDSSARTREADEPRNSQLARFSSNRPLRLDAGVELSPFQIAYKTYGTLNADRSNAVLLCHALTGDQHVASQHPVTGKPGWWETMVGPGKPIDTERYFIICPNVLGACMGTTGPASTNPDTSKPWGLDFPVITIRDMVRAQAMLLDELKIDSLFAVAGGSMGGMQALQWGVSHPRSMARIVALTPMAKTAPWAVLITEAARSCLMADPAWTGDGFSAEPERGRRAYIALMSALATKTPAALAGLHDRDDAHRWFDGVLAQQRAIAVDPHDFLYQSWAYEAHDVGTSPGFGGDTAAALRSVQAEALVLCPPLDLFNPETAGRDAAAAMANARYVEIPSAQGHQAATSLVADDAAFLNRTIGEFLSR